MLLEFKCSNHRSIKDKITFSMIAGNDKTHEESLIEFGDVKVLRSAAIYGANGSGKSNFLSALSFMQNLVINSIKLQPGQTVFQDLHKLSGDEDSSSYSIQFVKKNVRFAYGFSLKHHLVQDEYLYSFPSGQQTKIFEREGMDIMSGDEYEKSFAVSLNVLKKNRLFLSCAANYSQVKVVEDAFTFFSNDVVFYNPESNNWTEYSINAIQNNADIKAKFIDMLQSLGTNVKDIKLKIEKVKFNEIPQTIYLPDSLKKMIESSKGNKIEARIVYDNFEVDLLQESEGVKKLFQIICPMIDILENGKILICDELDSSLHEAIVFQIIRLFQNYKKGSLAQMVFSTHNTNFMNLESFRKDQIWFTELNKERATDLYSLAEFRGIKKSDNLRTGYISGRYGAIPVLNESFTAKIKSEYTAKEANR